MSNYTRGFKHKDEMKWMTETFGIKYGVSKYRIEMMVNEYLKSGNALQAYKKVYNPRSHDKNIKANATKKFKHPYFNYFLCKRTKDLEDKMDKDIIMNRERILKELEEILVSTKDCKQYNNALKALDQISKLLGAYAPEKSEIEHKGIVINYIKPTDNNQ